MQQLRSEFKISLILAMSVMLVIAGLMAANATQAGVPASQAQQSKQTSDKITAPVRAQLSNPDAKVRYLVVLEEQANVQNDITDWNAKGQYVLDALKSVANRTQPAVRDLIAQQVSAGNADTFKSYYIINGFSVVGNLASAEAIAALPGVASIDEFPLVTLDSATEQASFQDTAKLLDVNNLLNLAQPGPNAIEWNVNIIRAPQAWAMTCGGNPCNGTGVTVGSLDTGARYTHQALVNKYRGNLGGGSFDHNYNWWHAVGSSPSPVNSGGGDSYHGSHTIGTILGDDGGANQIGVAPGAKWIAVNGIASPATDADIIEAGQWILAPWDLNGLNPMPSMRPQVVSNSWGYGASSFSCSTATFFRTQTLAWTAAGIFPSFSAGNAGTTGNRPPSAYPETFETGSITNSGVISSFSSRGPSCYDGAQHPQVMAGGSNVRSVDGAGDTTYKLLNGTSMAQPATAGAAAILLQANPSLTIPQLWYILTSTAYMSPTWGTAPNFNYGWGLIQLDAAVLAAQGSGGSPTVTATPVTPSATATGTVCVAFEGLIGPNNPGKLAQINVGDGSRSFGAARANAEGSANPGKANYSPSGPVSLIIDDGVYENSVGWTDTGQTENSAAIWINRFSPTAGQYPLTLNEISILFPAPSSAGRDLTGEDIDLLVYLDADGNNDPSNAVKLLQQTVQIETTDGTTFSTYPVNVAVSGPGDVYIGFLDSYNAGGVSPVSYPAALDQTASQVRSWVAGENTGDADTDNLGGNDTLGIIDTFGLPGNWTIRASGTAGSGCPTPGTATTTATPGTPTAIVSPTCVPTGGSWVAKADLPTTLTRAYGAYFPANGKFYALGGRTGDGDPALAQLNPLEFDPVANTWTQKSAAFSDVQTSNTTGGVVTMGGTPVIIVVGGSAGGGTGGTTETRVYNPVTDSMTSLATDPWTPGTTTVPGGSAVVNNKLYVFGGFVINVGMSSEIWEFDPDAAAGSRWTLQTATLPTALGYIPAAAVGTDIYTIGGSEWDGSTLVDSAVAYKYDTIADTITAVASTPRATGETRAVTVDGKVWVLGGGRVSPNPGNQVEIYDPVSNSYSAGPSFTGARRNAAAGTDGTKIWIAGGYDIDGTSLLSSTEEFTGGSGGCGPTITPTNTSTATATSTGTAQITPPTNTATATATSTACVLQFTDVEEGSTFYEDIRCLACRGIINGYSTGCETGNPCFRPGNLVTRGQLAKIASNSAGFFEPVGSQQYEDVLPGSTFYDFIWRLTQRGLVNGYPCGGPGEPCGDPALPYFRPSNPVTRGQLTKIVANAAGLSDPVTGQQYEDVPPGHTFYDYIGRLTALGVINGYPCGGLGEPCGDPALPYFRPGANATRGQASKIVANTFFPGCVTPFKAPITTSSR